MIALLAAVTMSATVVTMDFTSSTELTAMGVDNIPAAGKDWTLTGKSLVKDGVTLTGVKVAKTDNRIFATQADGALTLRSYYIKDKTTGAESKNTLTFTVASPDVIKGLVFDGTAYFDGVEMNKIVTNAASVTLSCNTNATIKSVKVYVNEDIPVQTVDTISVSEARARIAKGEKQACYVKGVVSGAPFLLSSKYYTVWLTDIDNPSDSIEAYKMRPGKASTDYTSLDEMKAHYGLLDTVMIMAEGLDMFKTIYETTSGYYVETLGKSTVINGNQIFSFGVGAKQLGMSTSGTKYKYEVVLSKVGAEDFDDALHMVINSAKEKGIAGSYTISNFAGDSSFVDGEGPVAGTLEIAYVAETGEYINYAVKADFSLGGKIYHIDSTYTLAGWTSDLETFKLVDDIPFVPEDGDTITCAQAQSYAMTLGSTTSTLTVWVRGYATGFQTIQGRTQQSVYMADDASAQSGIFMGYLCYTQGLDSIIKGDEILVKGKISYFASKSLAQISKGNIYRIGGSNTKRAREINCVEVPAGAITVAQALEIGNKLTAEVGQTVSTDTEYTVYGYIVDVNRQTSKDSATWYMHDVKGEYGDFKAYKCYIPNLIDEDDYVFVTGKISKYQKSAEVANIEIATGAANFACDPTGLEQVKQVATKSGARKVMMNGQMFIMKDGVLYNALGVQVQ